MKEQRLVEAKYLVQSHPSQQAEEPRFKPRLLLFTQYHTKPDASPIDFSEIWLFFSSLAPQNQFWPY